MSELERFRARTAEMVADAVTLLSVESPSSDVEATARCARAAEEIGTRLLGRSPQRLTEGGRPALLWPAQGEPALLLLCHLDTVWPHGTLDRWPITRDGGRLSGPGAFDMKTGAVQGLYAMAGLSGAAMLLTTDEEIGSPTSRGLIERVAAEHRAVLVLEAAAGGALKVGRKGVSIYRVEVTGRAAHAGLEPERGVNAFLELTHQGQRIAALGDPAAGTSVTPTVAHAGTTTNTVPARATLDVDVRATTVAEQRRVHEQMRALAPALDGAAVRADGGPNRPPMEPEQAAELFGVAVEVAADLGLPQPRGVSVGGASDGNFTAGIGVPTLDGLGAVGDHAHAEGEYAEIAAMPERAALVAGIITRVARKVGTP